MQLVVNTGWMAEVFGITTPERRPRRPHLRRKELTVIDDWLSVIGCSLFAR